jgi:hypothetical protein
MVAIARYGHTMVTCTRQSRLRKSVNIRSKCQLQHLYSFKHYPQL